MCPIVGDEGGHVVGGAVACQAGAEVAAVRVVAGGVLPTDPMGSYLTLIFIWKTTAFIARLVCRSLYTMFTVSR